MKKATFLNKIKVLDYTEVFIFIDKDFDGHCPCSSGYKTIEGEKLYIETNCWRGGRAQTIKVTGKFDAKFKMKVGEILKKKLDETEWYNEYQVEVT